MLNIVKKKLCLVFCEENSISEIGIFNYSPYDNSEYDVKPTGSKVRSYLL